LSENGGSKGRKKGVENGGNEIILRKKWGGKREGGKGWKMRYLLGILRILGVAGEGFRGWEKWGASK